MHIITEHLRVFYMRVACRIRLAGNEKYKVPHFHGLQPS